MKNDLLDRSQFEILNKRGPRYNLQDAEKIRTLNDKARPRDPYDLVILQKKLGLKLDDGLALLAKKEMFKPLNKKSVAENLRISQERFEDEMEELYYREPVTKEEIQRFSDELLKKIVTGSQSN